MTTIGKRIYAARSKKGYTQAKLAKKIGVKQAQISQWENDKATPLPRHMVQLERVLGPLEDMAKLEGMAQQIRELVEQYPVSVRDIAEEAGLNEQTIKRILDGRVNSPQKDTVDGVTEALKKLRKQHREKGDSKDIDYGDTATEGESEQLAFLAEAGVGQKIKSIRFFDPHDTNQLSKLPDTPGVYLVYAGGNNLAVDHAFKSNEPINLDKIKMVGTPEYIGKANKLRTRIRQHRYRSSHDDWWWRKDWIDLAICIEVDGRGKLHEELETLLIKLLSPQVNVRKQGVPLR